MRKEIPRHAAPIIRRYASAASASGCSAGDYCSGRVAWRLPCKRHICAKRLECRCSFSHASGFRQETAEILSVEGGGFEGIFFLRLGNGIFYDCLNAGRFVGSWVVTSSPWSLLHFPLGIVFFSFFFSQLLACARTACESEFIRIFEILEGLAVENYW